MIDEHSTEEHPLATIVRDANAGMARWRRLIFLDACGLLINGGFLLIRGLDIWAATPGDKFRRMLWMAAGVHGLAGLLGCFALRTALRRYRMWHNLGKTCQQVIDANTWGQRMFFLEQAETASLLLEP